MQAVLKKKYSSQEYLDLERKAEFKSEYYQGEIFAMAGASTKHNIIVINIIAGLINKLAGKNCRPFGSDMRVHIPENSLFTYPDVSVVCGKFELLGDDNLLNTKLIVEVLSPSTANYDRGGKFALYRSIESLQEYALVEQDIRRVEIFRKNSAHRWELFEFVERDSSVEFTSVDCLLSFEEIYADIDRDAA